MVSLDDIYFRSKGKWWSQSQKGIRRPQRNCIFWSNQKKRSNSY